MGYFGIHKKTTAIKFLIVLFLPIKMTAQDYTVGVPVCDTIVTNMRYDALNCPTGSLQIRLDRSGKLTPYVTGLNFQVEITAVHGTVIANVSDTLEAGDVFLLPAANDSGVLNIVLPESTDFFEFLVKIIGTPTVAGENYYCNIDYAMTTAACHNELEIYVVNAQICMVQSSTAQNYTVGLPVCDTLCAYTYAAACPNAFLGMALDSTLIPYVTGLSFQAEITAVNGPVYSNISGPVKVGDVFPLPAVGDSVGLVINLPNVDDSFSYLIKIMGTPSVPGEEYYCNPICQQTLRACQNGLTVLALPLEDSICTVQSYPNSVDDGQVLPTKYELKQNYPNPFNPETTIEYTLLQKAFVKLKIYNLLGQEVKSLVNDVQEAGVKSVTWDGTNDRGEPVTSGVYILQIVAGEFSQARKVMLLK